MKKNLYLLILCLICLITGCYSGGDDGLGNNDMLNETDNGDNTDLSDMADDFTISDNEIETEQPVTIRVDLSDYFQGINGCAVLYNTAKREFSIYNADLAKKRSSPCSTFKIISTLIGLETGVIDTGDSVIEWSGVNYPIDEWNHDQTLKQAFMSSCVWYFRDVLDKAGKEAVAEMLARLSYGNRDFSQWEGSGVNGDYSELNGFWLESSLLISPMEQVEILLKIFDSDTGAYSNHLAMLKDIMKVDIDDNSANIYGKTGTGFVDGRCVDAWFVGFAETKGNIYYFSIRLDDPDNEGSNGNKAKEISLDIINDLI